jgi:hypothetical protein
VRLCLSLAGLALPILYEGDQGDGDGHEYQQAEKNHQNTPLQPPGVRLRFPGLLLKIRGFLLWPRSLVHKDPSFPCADGYVFPHKYITEAALPQGVCMDFL